MFYFFNEFDIFMKFIQNINDIHDEVILLRMVKISFLDVLLMRNNGKLETTVFRKETNNNVYLH